MAIDSADLTTILDGVADPRLDDSTRRIIDAWSGDPVILAVGPRGGPPTAVVRIARGPVARSGLTRAASALAQLRADIGNVSVAGLLPEVLGTGELTNRSWLVETALPGASARQLLLDPSARRFVLRGGAAAIGGLHAATSQWARVDADRLRHWLHDRAALVRALLLAHDPNGGGIADLAGLETDLAAGLAAREVTIGWIHGDLWPGNILVDPVRGLVTGLIDWDSAEPGEPAFQDLLHLALTTRRRVERRDLGALIIELLNGAPWTDDDRIVLGSAADPAPPPAGAVPAGPGPFSGLDRTAALWLYWLRAIEVNLARHPELGADRRWTHANVLRVLACR